MIVPLDTATGAVDFNNFLAGELDDSPSSAVRDPAGRIRTYTSDERARTVDVQTFWTYSQPDSDSPSVLPHVQSEIKVGGLSNVPPTAAFVTQFPKKPEQVTYTDKTGTYKGTAYPVYEFVMYGEEHAWCQVDRFGTAQVFPDLYLGAAKPQNPETIIISRGSSTGRSRSRRSTSPTPSSCRTSSAP